jgi:ATP-dependent DNA helicase DinG
MLGSETLPRHRAAVDRGERSVLFGPGSLAEAVRLPGECCTQVVIARHLFSVSDSSLEETRRKGVSSRGGSHFVEITVPEAPVRLEPGIGWLLRTVHDRGRVTILGRQIVLRCWCALLMRGLPDFAVMIERGRGEDHATGSTTSRGAE